MNAEDFTKAIHDLASGIHDSTTGTTEDRRMQVAAACGYMDSRTMVFYYETYGLHIADQIPLLRTNNLKPDWGGIETELYKIGKKPSSIKSMIHEAKEIALMGGSMREQ